jgi:beta-1,4-N-acetylglucosaminyltransferase
MIFVTVGNDFRGFDRLLKQMDELAPSVPSEILIQRGYSQYVPKNTKHVDFIPMDKAIEYIRGSELVVSHAGIGTIILCKKYGTPILILPRRKTFAEHMNDHQLEIAQALEERKNENIYVIYQEDQMKDAILTILKEERNHTPPKDTGRTNLIEAIRHFIKATL